MRNLPSTLYYIGKDNQSRPRFVSETGAHYVDTNCGYGTPRYCTIYYSVNPWYGEPDIPMPGDWKPEVINQVLLDIQRTVFSFVVNHDLSIISRDNYDEMRDYLTREFEQKFWQDPDELKAAIKNVLDDLLFED